MRGYTSTAAKQGFGTQQAPSPPASRTSVPTYGLGTRASPGTFMGLWHRGRPSAYENANPHQIFTTLKQILPTGAHSWQKLLLPVDFPHLPQHTCPRILPFVSIVPRECPVIQSEPQTVAGKRCGRKKKRFDSTVPGLAASIMEQVRTSYSCVPASSSSQAVGR